MTRESYYEILGVSPDASFREIKSAYHRLVKRYHPDCCPDAVEASRMTILLNEAYRICSNPDSRRTYDGDLARRSDVKVGEAVRVYSSRYCLKNIWLRFQKKHP